MTDLRPLFDELASLLKKHARGLELVDHLENSTAKTAKPTLILQGKTPVKILNRPPQKTYIAGVILQKRHVGFYFMPLYADPKNAPPLSADLQRALTGKACFSFTSLTPPLKKELNSLLTHGIQTFRQRHWI